MWYEIGATVFFALLGGLGGALVVAFFFVIFRLLISDDTIQKQTWLSFPKRTRHEVCPHCRSVATDPVWIGWRYFKGVRCRNCQRVTLTSSWFLERVFIHGLLRFWDGSVIVGQWTTSDESS